MNRRQFVSSLGAATVVPAGIAGQPDAGAAQPGTRARISLEGAWERSVNGALIDVVQVPSSLRPSGYYRLKRGFVLPKLSPNQRAIAHFDAINCHGRVFVNGAEMGTTIPYVPHEFDVTRHVREGNNSVEAAIADLCPDPSGAGADEVWLGVNPGWEGYGGIIRPAYLDIRPASYIDTVRLGYELNRDHTQAECRVTVFVSSDAARDCDLTVVLRQGKTEVTRARKSVRVTEGVTEAALTFRVNDVALWSPEIPTLYELSATLQSQAGDDGFLYRTGFRNIAVRGSTFELNGSRLILNGLCRHDMWKDQGFTLTRRQMEQDMRAIKALGANFIRLVHYPHDRHIIELADELGLLVSEEPGFWGMDFRSMPASRAALGLRIMERVIRRDWNSPSVFAWLLGNESEFTVEYLRKGKALCRSLDPIARLVSIANSMKKEDAKPVCEESGMDFFDDHPYTFDINQFNTIAAFYGPGKPLLFTEWGGREIGQSEIIMPNTVDRLLNMTAAGTLAGHAFWSWQDLPQFSRIDQEMRDGILESGVVTEAREPRGSVYAELARLFQGRKHVALQADESPVVVPLRRPLWPDRSALDPVDLTAVVTDQRASRAWADFESRLAKFWTDRGTQWERTGRKYTLWKNPEIEILGARFVSPVVDGIVRPVVVTPAFPEVEIPIGSACKRLYFLGHVTCPGGFPVDGAPGEQIGVYNVRFEGGKRQEVPLRNGIEVVRANIIHEATRIHPVATAAQQAFWFMKDWAREQYQGLLFSLPLEGGRVESVRVQLTGPHPLLLFAITGERS